MQLALLFGGFLKWSRHDILRIVGSSTDVFDSGFDVGVLAAKRLHQTRPLDLGPAVVDTLELLLVVLDPPEAVLEEGSHHD